MKEVTVKIDELASVIEEVVTGKERIKINIEETESFVEIQMELAKIIIASKKLKDRILEAVCRAGMKKFRMLRIDNECKEGLSIEFPRLGTNRISSFVVQMIGIRYGMVNLNGLIDGMKYTESGRPSSYKELYIEILSSIDNLVANTEDSGQVELNINGSFDGFDESGVVIGSLDLSNRNLFMVNIGLRQCQRINMYNCRITGLREAYKILISAGAEIYIRKLRNFGDTESGRKGKIDGKDYRECNNGVIVRADKESYEALVREEGAFSSVAKTADEMYKARARASKMGCELPDYLKYVLLEDSSS